MAYDDAATDLFGGTSPLLTQRDMFDAENLKDAEFELARAEDDHQLARWARRWGYALISAIQTSEDRSDWTPPEDLADQLDAARDAARSEALAEVDEQVGIIRRSLHEAAQAHDAMDAAIASASKAAEELK